MDVRVRQNEEVRMDEMANWASEAVGDSDLGDQRRRTRLLRTLTTLGQHPGQPVPRASADWAEAHAMYRLWQNDQVQVAELVASIGRATGARAAAEATVLLVQDTTDIAPTAPRRCADLGPLGDGRGRGLKLHTTLVVTPGGIPLGLGHQQLWTRDEDVGTRHQRYQTPVEGKESAKWLHGLQQTAHHLPPAPRYITVADREADIYELHALHQQLGGDFVVRSAQDRGLVEPAGTLAEAATAAPVRGHVEVAVPRADGKPERQATVTVRSRPVTLTPPQYASHAKARRDWWADHPEVLALLETPLEPLRLTCVEVTEDAPPDGVTPLHWRLLTTLPAASLEEAERVIDLYRQRWVVERFHYVLKSGCRIEEVQLEQADRLERAVVTYSLVAWRLLWLTLHARGTPDVSCETVVPRHHWQAAYATVHRTRQLPQTPPTLAEFVGVVGRLGGHLGRTRDGPPGVKTLWRGLTELARLVEMWEVLHGQNPNDEPERTGSV